MELYNGNAATLVLVGTVASVGYKWMKHWHQTRTYVQLVKDAADLEQTVYEIQNSTLDDSYDEALSLDVTDTIPRRKLRKGVYRTYLVKEGKAKFGSPTDNVANRMVVRKYLYDTCRADGLLARHICDHLEIATALVFVPSKDELTAAAITKTSLSCLRTTALESLEGKRPTFA